MMTSPASPFSGIVGGGVSDLDATRWAVAPAVAGGPGGRADPRYVSCEPARPMGRVPWCVGGRRCEVPRAGHLLLADREKVWLSPAAGGGSWEWGTFSLSKEAGALRNSFT